MKIVKIMCLSLLVVFAAALAMVPVAGAQTLELGRRRLGLAHLAHRIGVLAPLGGRALVGTGHASVLPGRLLRRLLDKRANHICLAPSAQLLV